MTDTYTDDAPLEEKSRKEIDLIYLLFIHLTDAHPLDMKYECEELRLIRCALERILMTTHPIEYKDYEQEKFGKNYVTVDPAPKLHAESCCGDVNGNCVVPVGLPYPKISGREPVDYQCGFCTHVSMNDPAAEQHFEEAHPEYYYNAKEFHDESGDR